MTTTAITTARGKIMHMFERHKCDNCGRKFRKIEELMQHQQLTHEESMYVCNQCNLSFEGMEQMRDHAKKFHSYHKRK
jgi:predicted nucleic acid-binding Zn ribbon protein